MNLAAYIYASGVVITGCVFVAAARIFGRPLLLKAVWPILFWPVFWADAIHKFLSEEFLK